MAKGVLFIVDMQNDFVDPKGSLYVEGAEVAVDNMIKFIKEHGDEIDYIVLSQDSHNHSHIATPDAWEGNLPVFTKITKEEVNDETRVPKFLFVDEFALSTFCANFNSMNEITLWPHHCVIGTWGWCFPDKLIAAISEWKEDKYYDRWWCIVNKGSNDFLEEYSALDNGTVRPCNKRSPLYYMNDLRGIDRDQDGVPYKEPLDFYIGGVAKDYCVASTLKSLHKVWTETYDDFLKKYFKVHFLEDCMATIDKTNPSLSIYDEMIKNGYADRV